jgi:hypothetical protein
MRLEIKWCARIKIYSGDTPPYSFMGCCLISLIKNVCLVPHPAHLVPVCTYSSLRLILGRCSLFQVDFDDGHFTTSKNQIMGLYNFYRAVHSLIPGVPTIHEAPVLMLWPRAWNMVEHSMLASCCSVALTFNMKHLIYESYAWRLLYWAYSETHKVSLWTTGYEYQSEETLKF